MKYSLETDECSEKIIKESCEFFVLLWDQFMRTYKREKRIRNCKKGETIRAAENEETDVVAILLLVSVKSTLRFS